MSSIGIQGMAATTRSKWAKDETGNTYGRLTVLYRGADYKVPNGGTEVRWQCRCQCPSGNECLVRGADLRSGKTKSCGCLAREVRSKRHTKDLLNQRFGSLVVTGRSSRKDDGYQVHWDVVCDCGETSTAPGQLLRDGNRVRCSNKCAPYVTEMSLNRQLYICKQGAKTRGLSFELSTEEFRDLIQRNCFYCNEPPSEHANGVLTYKSNGIDRLDNSIGYIKANCVTACASCNLAKGTKSVAEFLKWAVSVVHHSVTFST